jgi:hypothetical protein
MSLYVGNEKVGYLAPPPNFSKKNPPLTTRRCVVTLVMEFCSEPSPQHRGALVAVGSAGSHRRAYNSSSSSRSAANPPNDDTREFD